MENAEKIKVIILAAGKGTRMQSSEPKALTLLKGKAFLTHILNTLETLDLPNKPIIVVGHQKEKIIELLGDKYTYAHQAEQLGTGNAVSSTKEHIGHGEGLTIVLSSDQPLISIETLTSLINKHFKLKPTITMGTATLPDFKDWREGLIKFGRIIRDKNNHLKDIVEFKNATDKEKSVTEVNPAIYAFDNKWLWANINKINNNNTQGEYLLTDLIKIACEQNKKIETIKLSNILELLQPNTKEELEVLEELVV